MLVIFWSFDNDLAMLRINTYPTVCWTFTMDSSPVNAVVIYYLITIIKFWSKILQLYALTNINQTLIRCGHSSLVISRQITKQC